MYIFILLVNFCKAIGLNICMYKYFQKFIKKAISKSK